MRTALRLIVSWAAGLAAYAAAMRVWYGEIMSSDNWMLVGSITLVAWVLASALVIAPVLRRLAQRSSSTRRTILLAAAGTALAIVPVWLTVVGWYGWDPRHLLGPEAGLLGVLYGTSGLVLGLSLSRRVEQRGRGQR